MLELTLDSYYDNLYYRSLDVVYSDIYGNVYLVLEVEKNGVNFNVTLVDFVYADQDHYATITKILGGHEILFVEYAMENVYDL